MGGVQRGWAVSVFHPNAYPRFLSPNLVAQGCFPRTRFLVCSFGERCHKGAIARERKVLCASDHLLPPLAAPLDALNAVSRLTPHSMLVRTAVQRPNPLTLAFRLRLAPLVCRLPPVSPNLRVHRGRSFLPVHLSRLTRLSENGGKAQGEPFALRRRSLLRSEGLDLDSPLLSRWSLILRGYPRYYPFIWYGAGVFAGVSSRYARIDQRLLGAGGARREESGQCREYR